MFNATDRLISGLMESGLTSSRKRGTEGQSSVSLMFRMDKERPVQENKSIDKSLERMDRLRRVRTNAAQKFNSSESPPKTAQADAFARRLEALAENKEMRRAAQEMSEQYVKELVQKYKEQQQ